MGRMKVRRIEDIEKEKLEAKLEDSIFLRAIDFGLGYPDGFTFDQITKGLKLEGWEAKIVNEYLEAAFKNAYAKRLGESRANVETPFFVVELGPNRSYMENSNKYIISFDAHFKFIDYHELKFARENAKEAKSLATIAIGVSVGAALISIFMPIFVAQWFTQNVKLDNDQLENLKSALMSTTSVSNP